MKKDAGQRLPQGPTKGAKWDAWTPAWGGREIPSRGLFPGLGTGGGMGPKLVEDH